MKNEANCLHLLTDQSRRQVFTRIRTYDDRKSVTKAIFSYFRDYYYLRQYLFVLCDILSNCRHHVSFGHETRISCEKKIDPRIVEILEY